jgi:hypothetical protein
VEKVYCPLSKVGEETCPAGAQAVALIAARAERSDVANLFFMVFLS